MWNLIRNKKLLEGLEFSPVNIGTVFINPKKHYNENKDNQNETLRSFKIRVSEKEVNTLDTNFEPKIQTGWPVNGLKEKEFAIRNRSSLR